MSTWNENSYSPSKNCFLTRTIPVPITLFMVADPKCREIVAADFRDRVVHPASVSVLEPLFEKRLISHRYPYSDWVSEWFAMLTMSGLLPATEEEVATRFSLPGMTSGRLPNNPNSTNTQKILNTVLPPGTNLDAAHDAIRQSPMR